MTKRPAPPVEHRFKPGVSGNPSGRPKHTKDTGQIIDEILQESVSVADTRGPRRRSVDEVRFRQVVAKAMTGDVGANKLIANTLLARQDLQKAVSDENGARRALALQKLWRLLPHFQGKDPWADDDPAEPRN